ncbi:MAG: GspMb/PilO family protein [Asticcacaulis sp.]|uniref:GspMb/PilO family protein n=1 Tax=Asticcacaulis sp. TaxID=1872648 RepID=UPI003F7CD17D
MIDDYLSSRRRPQTRSMEIPLLAWGVAGLLALVGLGVLFLSRPTDAKARLVALEAQSKSIRSATDARGDLTSFPAGSVCAGQVDDALRNQLTNALMNSGLKVEALDIADAGQAGDRFPLRAYKLTLKGSGSYEEAMRGLQALKRYQPRLFLDTLSLRNETSSVDLDVEGRLFCRWKS